MLNKATLSIRKTHFKIGVHGSRSESAVEGFLSSLQRFEASPQVLADKYAEYKYNETGWRAIRP